MRLNRNTLIFLVVGVVFIIVAALTLPKDAPNTSPTPEGATPVPRPLFGAADAADASAFNLTDIVSFSIRDEATASETVYVQTTDGSWGIESTSTGKNGPLTQATIDDAVASVINLQADQFASDKRADFGLDVPQAVIRFKTTAGDENIIQLGKTNPSNTRRYALVNDDTANVYMINGVTELGSIIALAANPPIVVPPTPTPVPSLQMPGPLFNQFDAFSASRVEFIDNKTSAKVILVRDETTNWQIEEATNSIPDAAVDNSLVTVLLNAFGFLQGTTAIPANNLASIGLDKPIYTFIVTADNSTSATGAGTVYRIDVGNTDASGALTYVRVAGFSEVATVLTRDLQPLIDAIATPPYLPVPVATAEATSEATAESAATAEATTAP